MKKALLVALMGMTLFGCAEFGAANLPPKTEFFVSTGDIGGTNYQPVALIGSNRTLCTPCGLNLEKAYQKLEESLKEDMIDKAKALGANGIINLSYQVNAAGAFSFVYVRGLAVKF